MNAPKKEASKTKYACVCRFIHVRSPKLWVKLIDSFHPCQYKNNRLSLSFFQHQSRPVGQIQA